MTGIRTPGDGSARVVCEDKKIFDGDVEKPWLAPSPA
jgi:hypothetical protein